MDNWISIDGVSDEKQNHGFITQGGMLSSI